MLPLDNHPTQPPGFETQVRLQVRFSNGPAAWPLAYGTILETHAELRLVSLRILSPEHAEFVVMSHTSAGLAATLLALEAMPAESIEVRGDSLFASIAAGATPPAIVPPRVAAAGEGDPAGDPMPQAPSPRHGHLSLVQADEGGALASAGVDHLGVAVGPFRRFSEVNRFIDALGAVHDVRSVKPRRFRRGVLYALVDYIGAAPFTTALASMQAFPLRITTTTEDRIEATLLEPEDHELREIA